MGELLALLALVMYSTNVIVTKIASDKLDLNLGFTISVAVNVVCGGGVLLVQQALREAPMGWHPEAFGWFLLAGVFSTFLGRWLFFHAVAVLGPAKSSAFQVSNPMFTVVIAWIFLGETLGASSLMAIGVTVVGLLLVSYVPGMFSRTPVAAVPPGAGGEAAALVALPPNHWAATVRGAARSGVALALFSAASYSVSNVLRGAAVRSWNEPILGATLGALVGMTCHLVANRRKLQRSWSMLGASRRDGLLLYVLIGLLTITAQVSSISSMHYIPVSISNMITMSMPVLVTPASYFLLKNKENLRPHTVVGILLVLAGITMVVLR
ncbi:MAG: DMT family transporter [Deferrisomatales bacterium]|nr:DMT family transporter [Deferrisomatales bacterium]